MAQTRTVEVPETHPVLVLVKEPLPVAVVHQAKAKREVNFLTRPRFFVLFCFQTPIKVFQILLSNPACRTITPYHRMQSVVIPPV